MKVLHPGHPDLGFVLLGEAWLAEVEVVGTSGVGHTVKLEDIESVTAPHVGGHGYLALFDLLPPMRWLLLPCEWLTSAGPGQFTRVHLWACREVGISADCTNACEKLILANSMAQLCLPYRRVKAELEAGRTPWRSEI
jgi:hypothetical protein